MGAPEGRRIYGLLMGVSSQIGIQFARRLLDSFNQLFFIIGCRNLEIPPLPPPDHTSFCHGGPQSHFWSFLTFPPPPPPPPPSPLLVMQTKKQILEINKWMFCDGRNGLFIVEKFQSVLIFPSTQCCCGNIKINNREFRITFFFSIQTANGTT